jgi:hypothetical protein
LKERIEFSNLFFYRESIASVLKSIDQESRLHEKMSKAKLRLPITGKLISFTCLKRFLHSILWSKMFHTDLDTSNDIATLLDDIHYRTYIMRCCLSKLRYITSNGIKYYFDAENTRQEKLQMMLIDLHTYEKIYDWKIRVFFFCVI